MKLVEIEASFSKPKYLNLGADKIHLKWDGRWVYKLHSVIEEVLIGALDRAAIEQAINSNDIVDFGRFYWAKENLPLEQVYSDEWIESKMEDEYQIMFRAANLALEEIKESAISEQIKALESEKLKIESKLIDLKKAAEKNAFETCKKKYTKFLETLTSEEIELLEEVVCCGDPE